MSDSKTVPYNAGTEGPVDQLTRTVAQLRAVTASITGEGFSSFSNLNDSLQENMLWLVDSLVDQVAVLVDKAIVDRHPS